MLGLLEKLQKAAILTFWVHFFGPGFLEVPVRGSRCRKKQEEGEEKKNKKHKFGGDALRIREKREWEIKFERNKVKK